VKRQLSVQAFNAWQSKLRAKQFLTKNDVSALKRAINHKCSDAQAEQLLYDATQLPTEAGTIIEFEAVNCLVSGQIWRPVFASEVKK
jgi:hypothetical protein